MIWIFLLGCIAGGSFGAVIMALLAANREDEDRRANKKLQEELEDAKACANIARNDCRAVKK